MKQSSDLDDVFHGLPDILHTEILESAAKGDLRTSRCQYIRLRQTDCTARLVGMWPSRGRAVMFCDTMPIHYDI